MQDKDAAIGNSNHQINETEGDKYRRIVNEKTLEIVPLLNGFSTYQIEDVLKEVSSLIKRAPIRAVEF